MAPDVKFPLSHDAYDRFAELLAQHGISVHDTARDTTENLTSGTVSIESCSGTLTHRGHEFAYRRQKSFPDASLPWHLMPTVSPSVRVFRDGCLSIVVTDNDADAMEQLFVVLEQLFPDPPRQQQQLQPLSPWTRIRLFQRMGCLILLGLFGAFCFFAFYGIRTIFWAP